ncbi:phosphatidylinositol-glycan biosynthesis class X protein-like isoform X2 [Rhopilema esculentum]|uniref:phosphatidylinositol-glycan biosynthesis class X protein-like isoform X2 n=1 Tax=Rhopilema esculentum TaxID=499914 RepID=UPI0031D2C521
MEVACSSYVSLFFYLCIKLHLKASSVAIKDNKRSPELTESFQDLAGNGFHRNIWYHWVVQNAENKSCTFMIKQRIPAHMYIDMDEIKNLMVYSGSMVLADYHFNTEKPTYESDNHIVTIYPNKKSMSSNFTISMPVHLRYLMPSEKGGQVTLSLEAGSLYRRVTKKDSKSITTRDRCYDTSKSFCEWEFLGKFSLDGGGRSFILPTGNLGCTMTVVITTILVSSAASLIIVLKTMKSFI